MGRRAPVVAGQFYPHDPQACRQELEDYLRQGQSRAEQVRRSCAGPLKGGVVPHAGWMFSGQLAATVWQSLLGSGDIETVVLFGAIHRMRSDRSLVYAQGAWESPLGLIEMDEELAGAVVNASAELIVDETGHQGEHSIEVQIPFIQYLCPAARIVPILVPPSPGAEQVGRAVHAQALELERNTVYVGSSDLTHYGPRYQLTDHGPGPEGLGWAKQVNDCRMIDLLTAMKSEAIVPEAREHHNACGAGALAATIGAVTEAGASGGHLVDHTTSSEILSEQGSSTSDSVGYAGIVFA